MIIHNKIDQVKLSDSTIVAIGKFDGDHIGHQKLFSTMRALAKENGCQTVAITFDVSQILNRSKKLEMLEAEGIDIIILLPFSDEILSVEGNDFLKNFLVDRLNMKAIVAGPDCTFGHNKSGDITLLTQKAEEYGYTVHVIDKVRNEEGQEINSTMIRDLIRKGELERAKSYLGDSGKYL